MSHEMNKDLFNGRNVDYDNPGALSDLLITMENRTTEFKKKSYTVDLNSFGDFRNGPSKQKSSLIMTGDLFS